MYQNVGHYGETYAHSDIATLNKLLVFANLKSYNTVLINLGKNQKERM